MSKIKIGISGTHGTGKTQILNLLEKKLNNFIFYREVIRSFEPLNFSINKNANEIHQARYSSVYYYLSTRHDHNLITDRTIIDTLAYSRYSFKEKINKIEEKKFADVINNYNMIFYLSPEKEMEKDGVREEDEFYRKKIDKIILELYAEYYNDSIIKVNGTFKEIEEKILNEIEKKYVLR